MIALSPKALISAFTVKYDLSRNDKLILKHGEPLCAGNLSSMSSRDGDVSTSYYGSPEILAGKIK